MSNRNRDQRSDVRQPKGLQRGRHVTSEYTKRLARGIIDRITVNGGTVARHGGQVAINIKPSGGSGGGGGTQMFPAIVTATNGLTSHSCRYSASAISGGASVTLARPINRPMPTGIEIQEAKTGDPCIIAKSADGFVLWEIQEPPLFTSCQESVNLGNFSSGSSTGSHTVDRIVRQANIDVDITTPSISSGTQSRFGQLIYTFPQGVIHPEGFRVDLRITSPSITNNVRIGLGTEKASGTGTTLNAASQNLALQRTTAALSSSGTAVQFAGPDNTVTNDLLNTFSTKDGSSTPIPMNLNIAPTANWNASDSITITGRIEYLYKNLGVYSA